MGKAKKRWEKPVQRLLLVRREIPVFWTKVVALEGESECSDERSPQGLVA